MSNKYTDRFKDKKNAADSDWRRRVKWEPNLTGLFDEMPQSEVFENLSEPCFPVAEGTRKILFVMDWVPSEDLQAGKLLSGVTGDLFVNLMKATRDVYLKDSRPHFGWRVMTYSACRTVGKSQAAQDFLYTLFTRRLKRTIADYKPDVVVCLGSQSSKALIRENIERTGKVAPWLGVPIKTDLGYKLKHEFLTVSSLSLTDIIRGGTEAAYLLGYVARHFANAIRAKHMYAISDEEVKAHKSVYVDTMPKFLKLMDALKSMPYVSIDTETANLNKVTNVLQTVQFAKCTKFGYMVPILHKDTPFTPKELKRIRTELYGFFQGDNDNKYHIYANAKFDLLMMRSYLGLQYFKNDVWDIFGGEFALDENLGGLTAVSDGGYYSLLNLSVQYGTTIYLDGDFSKSERSTIAHSPLNKRLIRYGTTDVVVPFAIHLQQKLRAQALNYEKFERVVTKQVSDTIHGLAKMEHWGSGVDLNYLFYLNTPDSPIENELKNMESQFLGSKSIIKANRLLQKQMGVTQSKGLFGQNSVANKMYFDRSVKTHQQLLFFNVLGLEPISFSKTLDKKGNAVGKIDKKFKTTYADVPEVAQFTGLIKAEKLRNSYVKSFINLLRESDDFRYDHRIRPSYGYLKVVTYRINARDPNLQQIPSRSALGKHIKRLFVARLNCLQVKVDYRVHEVRCWGIISGDAKIAELFNGAANLWNQFRAKPTVDMLKRLKFEADIHVVNVIYFFGKTLKELIANPDMLKDLRDGVKGVTFGIIYQMSINSLAETIKQAVDYTQGIYDGFVKRFPKAIGWSENQKKLAAKRFYVEAPIGIRRNLFGYILPKFKSQRGERNYVNTLSIHSDMDRRAVNSPVQGFGAQCMSIGNRSLDHMMEKIRKSTGRIVNLYTNNSVHDSLENESEYKDLILSLDLIERALTSEVKKALKSRYDFDINSDLAIDFEIGAALSDLHKWDFSFAGLVDLVHKSLNFQVTELKREIDIPETMDLIFLKSVADYPKWLRSQILDLEPKQWEHYADEEKTYIKRYVKKLKSEFSD